MDPDEVVGDIVELVGTPRPGEVDAVIPEADPACAVEADASKVKSVPGAPAVGDTVKEAKGTRLSVLVTVTVWLVVPRAPVSSTTVRMTVKLPAVLYRWSTRVPAAVAPSPNAHS